MKLTYGHAVQWKDGTSHHTGKLMMLGDRPHQRYHNGTNHFLVRHSQSSVDEFIPACKLSWYFGDKWFNNEPGTFQSVCEERREPT